MAARPSFLISCLRRRLLLLSAAAVLLGLLSSQARSASPGPLTYNNILYGGETLNPGEYLEYGYYMLIMQEDCNFVLYDSGVPVWASGTDGYGSYCSVTMENDGNLVLYDRFRISIWESFTKREDGYYLLILQDDRNVVIYGGGAIWATNGAYGAAGVVVNGGLAAGRNETSPTSTFGSVAAAVVNAAGGGTALELGRKIRMATAKGLHG